MPGLADRPAQNGRGPNKRVIVLGAILVCVFVAWIVSMIAGTGFGYHR